LSGNAKDIAAAHRTLQGYLVIYGRATGQLDVAPPPAVADPENIVTAAIAKQRVLTQVGRRFLELLQADVEDDDALAEVEAAPVTPAPCTRVHPTEEEPETIAPPSPVPTAPVIPAEPSPAPVPPPPSTRQRRSPRTNGEMLNATDRLRRW